MASSGRCPGGRRLSSSARDLPGDLSARLERRRRFEHEARAASALSHPHICALYDVGCEVPSLPAGRREAEDGTDSPAELLDYLVIEFLDRQTLAPGHLYPSSFTADGRLLVASQNGDIVVVRANDGHGRVERLLQTPEIEYAAELSPDGASPVTHIEFIPKWLDELKAKVPDSR